MIGMHWILDVYIFKTKKWTSIFRHIGLGIGYVLCISAPGNYYRMGQSHDIVSNTYAERVQLCWEVHKNIITADLTGNKIFLILFLMAYSIALVMVTNNILEFNEIVKKGLPITIAAGLSVFVWAITPQCPPYGMDMWIIMIYSILFIFVGRLEEYIPDMLRLKLITVCTLFFMVWFSIHHIEDIYAYSQVSIERRMKVKAAVEAGEVEVIVPRFDDSLSSNLYYLGYLNNQNQYDTDYYRAYYGVRLIIQ